MNELNEATQRNMEMAEQSRGIADDLAVRAAMLNEALAAFRLADESDSDSAAREAALQQALAKATGPAKSRPGAAAASQEAVEFF
jgi:formiminotetrahydrofolate cyclodeaminase